MKKTIVLLTLALTLANSAFAINLGKLKVPGGKAPATSNSSGAVDTVTNVRTPHEQVIDDIMAMLKSKYEQQSTWFNTGDLSGMIKLVSAKYGKGTDKGVNGYEWYIQPKGEANCAYFQLEPYKGEARIKYMSTMNKPCE